MRVHATDRATHPGDGDLVRLLDGALSGSTRHAVEAHLVACEPCGERFAQLRERSTRLSRLLGDQTEVEWLPSRLGARAASTPRAVKPRRRRSRAPYAVAAGAMLAVVTAGPARGWIADGVRALLGTPYEETRRPATPAGDKSSGMAVTFAPEGDEVLFWLADPPSRGVLEVQATNAGRMTAAITRDQTTEEIIVVPNGVRVHNSAASVADYRLTVAPGARVRVRVGARGAERDTVLTATSRLIRIELGAMRSR